MHRVAKIDYAYANVHGRELGQEIKSGGMLF